MVKKNVLHTILLLFCTQLSLFCAGQLNYHFENITETNGLSDNRITCFYKDRTGFMWIGTENGLNRFDGHSFLIYKPGNPKHYITNPFINDIEQDTRGRYWVATQNGLNVIDPATDSTLVFLPDNDAYKQKEASIASNFVWDTYIDKKGRIWIAPDNRDLCYYDTTTQKFYYFPWKKFVLDRFPHRSKSYNSIQKIYPKSDDELWLGTSAGLFSFVISSKMFSYHNSYETDHFTGLQSLPGSDKVYFLQEPGQKVQELNIQNGLRHDIRLATTPAQNKQADVARLLWLPAGEHLLQINPANRETTLIQHVTDDPYSLPKGNTRVVFKDDAGLVWVGTDKGVGKFNPAMHMFSFTPVTSPRQNEKPENDLFRTLHNIHTVFDSEADNKYYISSPRNHALYIIDKTTGVKETIHSVAGIPLTRCSGIYEDSKGILWILASSHVFQYDRRQKKFSVFPFQPPGKGTLFTDMTEDAEGNLWFACLNDGLYCYNTANSTVWKPTSKEGLGPRLPTALYFDRRRNTLWIASFDIGLYNFDLTTKSFKVFLSDNNNPHYIHASLINDITQDSTGNIWIATYSGGVSVYNYNSKEGQEFENITTEQGLPENNVYALQTDHQGNIWATTYKGISCIDPDSKRIKNYDRRAGLPFVDFYSPITITRSGTLLTGIHHGFIRFQPDSVQYSTAPYPVVITSCYSNERDISSYIKNDIPVTLPHSHTDMQFNFAGLTYWLPGQTVYEYMIEEINKDWVHSDNVNIAKYNNLRPGMYTFKVRATDYTGKPSANIASFSFRILPPWWQTWWFRILAAMAVSGVLLALFKRRLEAIKRKADIRNQITELRSQVLRAQINPHFIFNSLNAIQELIVTENYETSFLYLSKFSRLLRQVLNNSDKNYILLKDELEVNELYLELESLRFKQSFTYSIQVDEEIDTEATAFPSLMLQPFIENAIWHGLMHKEGEKKLSISFTLQNNMLQCIIEDNGIGREKAAFIKNGKLGTQFFESKGTRLSQQRIELLNEMKNIRAIIVISDLKNEQGGATGTRVTLQIPIQYQL